MFYAVRKYGLKEVLRQWWVHSWFRGGVLVGTDAAGNKYFEVRDPRYYQHGKDRYIEYPLGRWDADASQIPPHWHGWMHHTHEDPPPREIWEEGKVHEWQRGIYEENMTGPGTVYKGKSTVPGKINSFK